MIGSILLKKNKNDNNIFKHNILFLRFLIFLKFICIFIDIYIYRYIIFDQFVFYLVTISDRVVSTIAITSLIVS